MRLETSAYYALGMPLYGGLLALEAWKGKRRARQVLRIAGTMSNLSCGIGQLLVGLFTGPIMLALYDLAFRHRVHSFESRSIATWALALVGVDFCYYWFHRAGHVGVLWGIHAVHHQSDEYNFAVSMRQPWFSDVYAVLFYWPLPLLGIPETPFFASVALLSLYQLSLHTEVFRRPGFGLLNSPEYHAVHHARNARYLGKNFGATLVIWDRLFGTFATLSKEDPPHYGSPDGYETHDGVKAQWVAVRNVVVHLARAGREGGLSGLVQGLLRAPDLELVRTPGKSSASANPSIVAIVEFCLAIVAATALLWARDLLPTTVLALGALAVLAVLRHVGATLDRS